MARRDDDWPKETKKKKPPSLIPTPAYRPESKWEKAGMAGVDLDKTLGNVVKFALAIVAYQVVFLPMSQGQMYAFTPSPRQMDFTFGIVQTSWFTFYITPQVVWVGLAAVIMMITTKIAGKKYVGWVINAVMTIVVAITFTPALVHEVLWLTPIVLVVWLLMAGVTWIIGRFRKPQR